ncbi:hypothetical protein HAP67_09670 [Acidithiobacillus albertensis]|nr:hypothetical protein [Acidithiobacillus albertensis]
MPTRDATSSPNYSLVKGDSSQIDNVISAEVTAEFRFVDRSVRARYLGEFLHAYPQLFAQKNPHPAKHLSSFHRQGAMLESGVRARYNWLE